MAGRALGGTDWHRESQASGYPLDWEPGRDDGSACESGWSFLPKTPASWPYSG